MRASFLLLVDFDAVSWEGVKFRGRACQRRDVEMVSKAWKSIRIKLRKLLGCAI
jgi:hypothetical protein